MVLCLALISPWTIIHQLPIGLAFSVSPVLLHQHFVSVFFVTSSLLLQTQRRFSWISRITFMVFGEQFIVLKVFLKSVISIKLWLANTRFRNNEEFISVNSLKKWVSIRTSTSPRTSSMHIALFALINCLLSSSSISPLLPIALFSSSRRRIRSSTIPERVQGQLSNDLLSQHIFCSLAFVGGFFVHWFPQRHSFVP